MKGIVFTEFLEMVESQFSLELSEQILQASDLPSGGIYTSVGTYDHQEISQLVGHLSQLTGISVPVLLNTYGQHLLKRFAEGYPQFFDGIHSTFEFLEQIDGYIHEEVKKLYPDAELPRFTYHYPAPNQLEMTYYSTRHLEDLAEGLIQGAIHHFAEKMTLSRRKGAEEGHSVTHFLLTKQG